MTKKYFGTDGIRGAINSKHINGDMFTVNSTSYPIGSKIFF